MVFVRTIYSDHDIVNEDVEANYVLYKSISSVAVRTNKLLKIVNQTSTVYQYISYYPHLAISLCLDIKFQNKTSQCQ